MSHGPERQLSIPQGERHLGVLYFGPQKGLKQLGQHVLVGFCDEAHKYGRRTLTPKVAGANPVTAAIKTQSLSRLREKDAQSRRLRSIRVTKARKAEVVGSREDVAV